MKVFWDDFELGCVYERDLHTKSCKQHNPFRTNVFIETLKFFLEFPDKTAMFLYRYFYSQLLKFSFVQWLSIIFELEKKNHTSQWESYRSELLKALKYKSSHILTRVHSEQNQQSEGCQSE